MDTRIPALDGIRGTAILLVLIWHYVVLITPAEPGTLLDYALACLRLTWSGVDLFFVLSGFLIGGILIDTRDRGTYFRDFWVRRCCRILPLYLLWLALFIALRANMPVWLIHHPLPTWTYAAFVQNFAMVVHNTFGPNWLGITWSLAVEEQFYLVLPFIILFARPSHLLPVLIALCAMAPMVRTAISIFAPDNYHAAYVLAPCRADALLLGVIVAWLIRQPAALGRMRQQLRLLRLALAMLALCVFTLTLDSLAILSFAMKTFGYSIIAMFYTSVLLIVLVNRNGLLAQVFSNAMLRKLGFVAYGVYILHQGLLGLSHGFILSQAPKIVSVLDILVTLGSLAFTIVLAAISWKYFERPIVDFGHSVTAAAKHAVEDAAAPRRPATVSPDRSPS